MVAIIASVTDDDMVEKMDAHGFASLFHPLGKSVVVAAGLVVVRGMVMAECKDGGVTQ